MSDTLEKVKVLKATMEEAEEKHHMNTSDDDEKWWATFYAWQEAKKEFWKAWCEWQLEPEEKE